MTKLIKSGFFNRLFQIGLINLTVFAVTSTCHAQNEHVGGYMIIPTAERVAPSFNAGFSMYVAAWSLNRTYPGHDYQTGLPGTWMFAQNEGPAMKNMYSDVEGGLGWWRDTRFPTPTPKFIMGGVGPNFSEIANGPSHGAGDWQRPRGLYGVAQLSPWLLFPIDGINVKQGACGELFGYGYLKLPLTDPKPMTNGKNVPTGGNSWTLFLNTKNFKGPVAFFTPYFWSHNGLKEERFIGRLLDSRPIDPNMAIQMETQFIPCSVAKDSRGDSYMRIAPTTYPQNFGEKSALVHQASSYSENALWNATKAWFDGGTAPSGKIDLNSAFVRSFKDKGYMTWRVYKPGTGNRETSVPIDCEPIVTPTTIDAQTFGCVWKFDNARQVSTKEGSLVSFPEYFRLENNADPKKAKWTPIAETLVPTETGLSSIKWETPVEAPQKPYDTPDQPNSTWKTPGPVAGPFKAKLGDGSILTYYWYKFMDQPALLNSDMTLEERQKLQDRIVKIHKAWTKNREYLPAPKLGKLAELDPAQIVKPPKGMEFGYVPIVTRQELAK